MNMSKNEFLEQLEEQLQGSVSTQEMMESIQYYHDYIEQEIKNGKTEEEVLDFLGSPNGIAKSIIDAHGNDDGAEYVYEEDGSYGYGSNDYGYGTDDNQSPTAKVFHLEGWKGTLLLVGILALIILLLVFAFKVVAAILPFVIPFAIIIFLINMFTHRN